MYKQSLASDSNSWQFRQAGEGEWLPAQVPGGVHTDLLALGRIPDPFVADNELKVAWVAETDWEYQTRFSPEADVLSQDQVYLVCDGLDTLAQVELNGQPVGQSDNMFRTYRWEISKHLLPGENQLYLRFASPVKFCANRQAEKKLVTVSQALEGAPHLRKSPCQFGWDWGPQLPPIGIWRAIRLEGATHARFEDTQVTWARQPDGSYRLRIFASAKRWTDAPLRLEARLEAPDGNLFNAQTPVVGSQAVLDYQISQPILWWPNGYGAQALYGLQLMLFTGTRLIDEKTYRIGLRSIELRQLPDAWGKSFTFVVNDIPIFAKGSNWIPADSFPTRLTRERLEGLLRSAADTHQNMLRVWGGGLYEDEMFYDLCDELGLLVWQDFMFSCSIYPFDDPSFVENVHHEVVDNVRRLRHRACLALWCGNNEMEEGWEHWMWDTPWHSHLKEAYKHFFFDLLPSWLAEMDPDRAYWPSTPSSNTPFKDTHANTQGDAHFWGVWHKRLPFSAYLDELPRFMSEFGFQSLPPLPTIQAFSTPKDWNLNSPVMKHRQRSGDGNRLILEQMADLYREPHDFQALVYQSLVLQAEGIRFGVEHWRRHKERVSGTIYWQLNDCWPAISWSSLDYFGRWKALHYMARRFYAPLLLSLVNDGKDNVAIHLTSDLPNDWQGQVNWSLQDVDGQVLDRAHQVVQIEALKSRCLGQVEVELRGELKRRTVLVARLLSTDGGVLAVRVHPLVSDRQLELSEPEIEVNCQEEGSRLTIQLRSRRLARFVELSLPGNDLIFSDNYFDLLPGEMYKVESTLPGGMSLDEFQKRLQVFSLYHAWKKP